jgi:hypothetical protein
MTFSNEELEKELASLQPVAPDKVLASRIEDAIAMDGENQPAKIIRHWPILILASAACLALVLMLSNTDRQAGVAANSTTFASNPAIQQNNTLADFEPVVAEQRLMNAIDDGVILTADNEPVRRLRYEFIDTVTMVSQSDGSVFIMEIPREEILLIPVTLL